MGIAVGGLISVAILSSIIGTIGTFIGAGLAGGGIWWIFKMQDKHGLYSKTRNDNEIHIIPTLKLQNRNINQN